MNTLHQILRQEITATGPITFARFMDLALYCPNLGYYEQLHASPGCKADFFTSVSVGDLFGELLARKFATWLEACPPGALQILEAGAHNADLASDILTWLQAHRPTLFARLEYGILEPSIHRTAAQKSRLQPWLGQVHWFDGWSSTPSDGFNGIIFSNELLDAFPIHRFGWDAKASKWFEWYVTVHNDLFTWTRLPLDRSLAADTDLAAFLKTLSQLPATLLEVLPDGFIIESAPSSKRWWREAATHLKSGHLLTLDYGLLNEEFFMPQRKDGTARAYFEHRLETDLLARPGQQDLTSHIDFTELRLVGESCGLRTDAFSTQSQFLTEIVAGSLAADPAFAASLTARSRQFQTLTHPDHLGRSFRVLIQSR